MTTTTTTAAHQAAAIIQKQLPHFIPKVGIILGSGLSSFANQLTDATVIPYEQLPQFPKVTVHGHQGNLVMGYLDKVPVACLQGRAHLYEGASMDVVKTYVRTLKLLGCEYFFVTNASGSLKEQMGPGQLMMITDHINLQPTNPLVGPNDDLFGPRFFPLDNAYDTDLRQKLLHAANQHHIALHQGVYISVSGPNYETAAEIRAFRTLGADAVGMSTVPEVLVANHCGLKVAAIATITNYATGLAVEPHSHDAVVAMANQAAIQLNQLIKATVAQLE